MRSLYLLSVAFLLVISGAHAQVFTNKVVGEKNQSKRDSLKDSEYPYSLPIWGAKATKAGYDLPYSAGLSSQYFWQESDIVIDNLMVGFNGGQMYNVDDLIRFNKAVAAASAVSVRPDIWLFPFLNVYAILGRTQASTDVGFGLWLPDSTNNYTEVMTSGSKVDFNASTFGIGMTPTIGVGGGFLALDMNVAWTDVPQLTQPARTFIFGPRLGKNFKLEKPQRAVAVWVGAFRVHLNSETNGSVKLSDVVPVEELQPKIDLGFEKVENAQTQVDTWWEGLSPTDQRNPINIAKYNAANSALTRASQILVAADAALNDDQYSTVEYSMDKRPANAWNFIVGTQYQFSKHLMLRLEYGFLGTRQQIITGVQYRFGL
ncbi:hypothetical protein C943_00981 [Mariniradius saccharolyticus AK6]|uniref:Outer membrane protein n=1 Tax=Mariniradius saccharolyticus AK6 TaxID=1239962 RepID=M7XDH9_9BACT|nr:hypothetical protein [Mariniradius saccharolyticus]EMS32628.1 hypothetical protein C943_00981 [Mariniradius saccharolyticus AK6]